MNPKIDLHQKFSMISEYYAPVQIASLNGTALKLAKFKGSFTWHAHEDSCEIFVVFRGEISILMRTKDGEGTITFCIA